MKIDKIKLPKFMDDMKAYKKALETIARTNFIVD
jgi:hypothetical protein